MSNPSANLPGFAAPVQLKSILKSKSTIAAKEQQKKQVESTLKNWIGMGNKTKPSNNATILPKKDRPESAITAYAAPSPAPPQRKLAPAATSATDVRVEVTNFQQPEPPLKDSHPENDRKRAALDPITVEEKFGGSVTEIASNVPRKRANTTNDAQTTASQEAHQGTNEEHTLSEAPPEALPEAPQEASPEALPDDTKPQAMELEPKATEPKATAYTSPSKKNLRDILLGKRDDPTPQVSASPAPMPNDLTAFSTPPSGHVDAQEAPASGMRFRRTSKKMAGGIPPQKLLTTSYASTAAAGQKEPTKKLSKKSKSDELKTKPKKQKKPKVLVDESSKAAKSIAAEAVAAMPKKKKMSNTEPKPKLASTTSTPKVNKGKALEIFSGVPDEDIGIDWTGWTKKTFRRQSGATAGSTDSYWYTPQLQKKLRSLKEVNRFMGFMSEVGYDEALAWNRLKGKA